MALQKTLLQVVQSTLGAMDSHSVDTIGENPESEQLVLVAREVYEEMATHQDIPQFQKLDQLLGLNDSSRATMMRIPDECTDIGTVRYRHVSSSGRVKMEEVRFRDKDLFLHEQLCLDVDDTDKVGYNVLESNIQVPYYRDRGPCYFTLFDDQHLIFDAVDTVQAQDNTLHNDASLVISYVVPEFEMRDDFIIPLPAQMQTQFLAQMKEVAFMEQKQMANPVQTEKSRRTRRRNWHMAGVNDGLNNGSSFEGFGREGQRNVRGNRTGYGRGARR